MESVAVIPSRVQLTLNAKAPKFLKNRETLIFKNLRAAIARRHTNLQSNVMPFDCKLV
jgi:hypothetical protein